MEFYIVSTESGKTFYMVIDKSQKDNNAYLLTEADLLNFTGSDKLVLPQNGAVITGSYEEQNSDTKEVVSKGGSFNQSPNAVGNDEENEDTTNKKNS